jgi:hypothetical protein
MKQWITASILALLALVGCLMASSARQEAGRLSARVEGMNDSLSTLSRAVDSLKAARPGIGDYMSAVQLHAAKLWYAGEAANWHLARYELTELGEAIDGAQTLHVRKNGVDISALLESVRQAQLATLDSSIAAGSAPAFGEAYRQALAACNGCHRAAGYEFIHITEPRREPVSNQRWTAG